MYGNIPSAYLFQRADNIIANAKDMLKSHKLIIIRWEFPGDGGWQQEFAIPEQLDAFRMTLAKVLENNATVEVYEK